MRCAVVLAVGIVGLAAFAACGSGASGSAAPDGATPDGWAPDGGATPDGGASPDGGTADDGSPDGGAPDASLVAERPYGLDVPADYDPSRPTPLVVLLHGYGASGALQDAYFGFDALAEERDVLVAHPDGTIDRLGNRFWNATDACCDLFHTGVDDVRYLNAVLDDAMARFNVDPRRVFFVGHSDGGFMAHRMACDSAARVAGIAALAGDVWKDPSRCDPVTSVSVLQVHGDADRVVPYAGGSLPLGVGVVPAAAESVATWAMKNRCTGTLLETGQQLDLESNLAGAETRVERFDCTAGAAELWTIVGGSHVPALIRPVWGNTVLDWLLERSR